MWFLWEGMSKEGYAGLVNLNNFNGPVLLGLSLNCLVPGCGAIRPRGYWPKSSPREVVSVKAFELVCI